MLFEENASLKKYNTFGLDYKASRIYHPGDESEIIQILPDIDYSRSILILGGGSNLLFTGDFNGALIHPVIGGIKAEYSEGDSVIVSAGSGINWDNFVEWTIRNGFYGLENLSLIPGNVGASPVQNIGAYGAEIRDSIVKVDTVRVPDGKRVTFTNEECGFAYRYSIFKGPEKGRYIVTRVHFRLSRAPRLILGYGSVKEEAEKLGELTPENIRNAVISIRRSKLPDPEITGNAGSFFKNPVVENSFAGKLKIQYPHIPVYPEKPGYTKIAAGWLIEQCGWKGKKAGEAGVHDKQALVIVNYGDATGKDIYELSESVRASVKIKFGINLDREVEVVGSI